ncbi:MAG: hypothetical protein FJ137_17660 [Deltaproteobacteria bacterium]|nr:hypothetical protein [Deltaproteobacteria bacterium]
MRIADRQLKPIAQRIAATPNQLVDDKVVLELLGAVADKLGRSADQATAALSAPGMTRKAQLELAAQGMSKREKQDLLTLLDQSGFTFSPGAKNFLEALVGRATLNESGGAAPLPPPPSSGVSADTSGIRGILEKNVVIEAINLSSAPALRLHLEDTKQIGSTDAQGRFVLDANRVTGTDAMSRLNAGDVIRLRGRRADGTATDWVELKVGGRDADNAQFNGMRLTLTDDGRGSVGLGHNTSRPLTEPGAKLRFTNLRTGDVLDATADAKGSIPAGLKIAGKGGDQIAVSVSDGTNNTDLKTIATTLSVLAQSGVDTTDDPKPHKDETKPDGTPTYPLRRYTGPLFVNGVNSGDVRQGAIGNCYFPAAVAAVAHVSPKTIEDAITETTNAAGERDFNVRFYSRSGRMEMVTVDADLYTRSWGGPIYGTTGGHTDADKMELWFPILEKAFAKWKGSYDAIGNGGSSAAVLTALTGKSTTYLDPGYDSPDAIFRAVKAAGDNKQPMCAGTHDDKKLYTNTGVYANHAYSVLGAEESGGKKYILLRNPWGESEAGNDGKNDGYFKLELSQFVKLYSDVSILRA